jgi:hypothetical protein
MSAGSCAVVALVRDEVLEDDLLEVAVLGVHGGQRLERADPLLGVSPMPTRIPLVKGIFSSPAARIVSSRARVLASASPGGRRGRG